MTTCDARPLFRPGQSELRFLPEGPYAYEPGRFSWVGIQHGGASTVGSLNLFDMEVGSNLHFPLPGRPGFAFPAVDGRSWVVGLERHVMMLDTQTGEMTEVCGPVEQSVEGTIINDGTLFDGGLVFGCKDLRFAEKKAGLYFWRARDRRLFTLRQDQICSNGKEVVTLDGRLSLLDIDSPTKTVVAYPFDVEGGTLGEPRVVLDLTAGESFPDGMVLTPDRRSCIIGFYDPRDVAYGEARQYSLADGTLEAVWRTAGSPRVTCPALVPYQGATRLVLTTAVEHMTPEQETQHPHAGCLFTAETAFPEVGLPPRFQWV
ncbi:MAG: SMP-30/gluconolactonase/LRE family protein [Pirellulales bacterium]